MGLFSRKTSNSEDARMHAMIREDQERRERHAETAAREAAARAAKWDRVVRSRTTHGDDGPSRDYAMRQRTQAQAKQANAEVDMLSAKKLLSDYRQNRRR
jgi:hypothetical protein